jgi:hypothetical protein
MRADNKNSIRSNIEQILNFWKSNRAIRSRLSTSGLWKKRSELEL